MDMGLKDKVAIVTGASRGLGRAIALILAAEGAQVVVADIDEDAAEQGVNEVKKATGKALAIKTDVSKGHQVQAMVDGVFQRFGRIDILVNNAGVAGPQGPWSDLTEDGFDLVIGINLKGTYLCSKAVTPNMINQQSGKIINISSSAGKTGYPFAGIYCATKAAILSLTQSMALELARHKINVNAVCPGTMDTDLLEKLCKERSKYFELAPEEYRKMLKSFPWPIELTVEDVANAVVFLASDKAALITGEAVNIAGGLEVH